MSTRILHHTVLLDKHTKETLLQLCNVAFPPPQQQEQHLLHDNIELWAL